MNSEKKLYEELLLEHPELKESQVDIQEVISLMKKMNPYIVPDQNYKNELKQRLDTIANYNPQKSHGFMWFLKYLIPVFSFGFAVFGFVYFSDEFKSDIKTEIENIAPASMMMLSESPDPENINLRSQWRMLMKSGLVDDTENTKESENISDDMWDDILDEMMPMMFSMDEVMLDSPENTSFHESDDTNEIWSMNVMSINEQWEIEDIFFEICWEYNGLIKVLEDWVRACILEDKNCYEDTYEEWECFKVK